MEKKIQEVAKEDNEKADEYFQFIRKSVDDGSYFKDALDWYFFKYVTPICDRTLLIFAAIISAIVMYFLVEMIHGAFPLVVEEPIFIKAKDEAKYFPELVALKPKDGSRSRAGYDLNVQNVDEAVAKYLLSIYIKNREGFDFSDAEIQKVNDKFNRVRNTSSQQEYRNFQLIMSKDNPNSPIRFFGKNVNRKIEIESVRFVRKQPKNLTEKALDYLTVNVPKSAEVRFVAILSEAVSFSETKVEKQRYLAKIDFDFGGVEKESKPGQDIKFLVTKYSLFKIR